MTTPLFPSVIAWNLLDGGTDAQDGNNYPGPLLQEYATTVLMSCFGSQGYSNLLTLLGDDIMFVGINYSQLPSAAANEGRIARVADRNNGAYVADGGVWEPLTEFVLDRLITQVATDGSTLTPKIMFQKLVPKDCLSRNGDIVRIVHAGKKSATTDNGLVFAYVGTTGVIATDTNVTPSGSNTLLSGTSDTYATYWEWMRVNATTLRRLGSGSGVANPVGNSTADIPTDYTVPNMDNNDVYFTIGAYTATGGGLATAEVLTLTNAEMVVRPFG
jgi:hypothetical protein